MKSQKGIRKDFIIKIILPSVLAITFFIISIFAIIIPSFERTIMDRKREMIRELTNTAWSVLEEFNTEEKQNIYSREEAQDRAVSRVQYMRYGEKRKDYFWITDMKPVMVMHPFRPDLNGQDLSGFEDAHGTKLFMEFVRTVKENRDGYVQYMWQSKDDSTKIVPKLSYVKEFKSWGWIIGTGIYIDDVKEEIAAMTDRLITISVGITVIIVLLLLYITQQSLRIEKGRRKAEEDLRESRERYRALVEAATEGILMVLENRLVYSNKTLLSMLGYTQDEFAQVDLSGIFTDDTTENGEVLANLYTIKEGKPTPSQYNARMKKKSGGHLDVVLTTSKINLGGKEGIILIAKDFSGQRRMREELGESREKYEALINNINIGVFRITLEQNCSFIEANPAALRIFGMKNEEDLRGYAFLDLLSDKEDQKVILKNLHAAQSVHNKILQLKRADGAGSIVSVSLFAVRNDSEKVLYCDGIVEDITEQKKSEEERENLIVELQASLLFLNQPIRNFIREVTTCEMNLPVGKAAALMARHNASAIIVCGSEGDFIGIITDRDLRTRVIAEEYDLHRPVFEIMSSPLISISERALVFEAFLLMQEKKIGHLAVKDISGKIISVISARELLQVHRYSSAILIKEIEGAGSVEEIIDSRDRLPRLVKALVESGADSRNITRIMTAVSDTIVVKLVTLAINELGTPPTRFAFMALGSEGREEQTLATDQDNAIVYADVDPAVAKHVKEYFLALGDKVCTWLDQCGYTLCKGDAMAKNPKWCQPLTVWKEYFSNWILTANPQDLMEINIFFDFRIVYGDKFFTDELRKHVQKVSRGKAAFYQHLAMNCLQYKPPIGFLGNIVVESTGEHSETFSIKKAIMPIVDFTRIYALQNNIEKTNTLDRLNQLLAKNILNKTTHADIVQAYNYLMQLRFKHQASMLSENLKPDNYINPKKLTHIEQAMVKNTLSHISGFQKKLSVDFTGLI